MMQLLKLTLAAALAVSVLSACTLSNNRWSNFDNHSSQIKPQVNQTGLVFYRADAGANPIAVNIKVNGEYLSSLQVGGFAKTEICNFGGPIRGSQTYNKTQRKSNRTIGTLLPN